MYYKTSDGKQLYYELHGNEQSGNCIVFLNGLSQSTVSWYPMLHAFADDYKVVLLDLVFQGQSDKNGEVRDFDKHAADVHELIDSLKIERVTIAGISYGSIVAQHFALNYSQQLDKLILLSTFAHKTPYYDAIELAWHNALEAGGYPLMFDVMLPTVLSENYFEHPLISMDKLRATRQSLNTDAASLKKLMMATRDRPDYREKLKAIKTPTLIIQGEKDALFPVHMAQAVCDSIPGSRLEVIPNAGHTLNLEAIPQTIRLIKEFTGK